MKFCKNDCLPQSILDLLDLVAAGCSNTSTKYIMIITAWLLWDAYNERVFSHTISLTNQNLYKVHQYLPPQQSHNPCLRIQYPTRHCGIPFMLNQNIPLKHFPILGHERLC